MKTRKNIKHIPENVNFGRGLVIALFEEYWASEKANKKQCVKQKKGKRKKL
jgi:hypothetical protein